VHDPDYFQQVNELARHLNVSASLEFMGQSRAVPSLLKGCDTFYLPSRSEGLSNAMLEAMACSLPCVAANVGGNRELVEEESSGFLVPPEEPAAAAERIVRLLRDPSLALRMGQRGRRIVEAGFSAQVMMARLLELYDSLLTTVERGVHAGLEGAPRRCQAS
jgi:glycosyltransferase involved in cell wall biosynthesis